MERSSSIVSWCVQFLHHCTGLKKLPQNDPSHIKIGPQDQKLQSKYWNVVASKSNWWQPPNSIPTKGRLFFWPIEVIWTEKSWNNFFEGYQNFISPWSGALADISKVLWYFFDCTIVWLTTVITNSCTVSLWNCFRLNTILLNSNSSLMPNFEEYFLECSHVPISFFFSL